MWHVLNIFFINHPPLQNFRCSLSLFVHFFQKYLVLNIVSENTKVSIQYAPFYFRVFKFYLREQVTQKGNGKTSNVILLETQDNCGWKMSVIQLKKQTVRYQHSQSVDCLVHLVFPVLGLSWKIFCHLPCH